MFPVAVTPPVTVSVDPSKVKLASALAVLVVPSDVNILLSTGFVIVLNPVPDVPLLPVEPEDPELPEDPVLPDVPEVPEVPEDPRVPDVPELPEDPLEPEEPV
jgi:hypothetical protein